jgi:PAT family beta-lactamase induction signal transducer AmpG
MRKRLDRGNLLGSTNGRFLAFGLMYVSEGITYGFTSVAMVAFMRQQGVSLAAIGTFVAAMMLPWGFKWAWAPLIDLIKLPRLGGRKAWIVFCTTMMIVTLLVAALVDYQRHFEWLLAMIVLNNLFAATQDVAIDSLAVSTLRADERGRGSGFMFGGQFLGIALGGGGAVYLNGAFGFHVALAAVALMMFMTLLFVVMFVKDPEANPAAVSQPGAFRRLVAAMVAFVRNVYRSFWKSGPGPRFGVAFALLPCGAMALAYATLRTLQVDYGLADSQIAALSVYNTVAGAIGCLGGGWLADRFGPKRVVALAFALTAVPTLVLGLQIATLGLQAVAIGLFYGLVIAHGLFFGMAYGGRNAIFLGLTNPAVAATQFTAYMGMSNLTISYVNYWQGLVAERFGYATVLYVDAALAILVIALIPFLRDRDAGSKADGDCQNRRPQRVATA